MTETLPEALEPYPEISSRAYEHPADRAATAALNAVPVLDSVVRKLVASASQPSATAATPPSPTDSPITRPDAVPI